MKRSEGLIYSENATVYQGVLEQFQSNNPDMLVVFKRERGFLSNFGNLIEFIKEIFSVQYLY